MRRYPDLKVDLTLNDRFVDVVEEGYDVVLRIAWLPDSSLVARRLCDFRRVICAAPGYWDPRGRPAAPAALAAHDSLRYAYTAPENDWRCRGPVWPRAVRTCGLFLANN